MTDVLVGSERRALITGGNGGGLPAPPPPPPESLLGRLDDIDLRVRQLEEQRRPAHAEDAAARRTPAPAPQHQHTKSLPSALQHEQLSRGTLMERLNLLETRIRQLSCELDLDPGAGGKAGVRGYAALGSSSSVAPPPQDPAWSESAPMLEPCVDPAAMCAAADKSAATVAADGSWSAVQILQRGARQLHRSKPNPPNKAKSLKEAKCVCQKEKRKAERNRTNRRWFAVGC
ncbi:hypothetical protein ACP70R_041952 [Stipagrostis hirtigluma subsp. patula]